VKRLALAALIACARVASADEPLADQKFDQALKLRADGKLAESCALFRESLQLNNQAIGTLLNVARCDEEEGKLAQAYRAFSDARDRAAEQHLEPQRQAADEHVKALAERVPHLALAFAAPPPPGARIVVDDQPVEVDVASDVRVDPGSVHVVVSAPGYVAFETHVAIAEGQHKAQVIPKLAPPVVVKNPRRFVGKLLTIAGGGAFVVAAGLAIGAKLDYDNQTGGCVLHNGVITCSPDNSNRANGDHTLGTIATGVGIAGLVMAAVGAGLWYFSPDAEHHTVAVMPTIAPGQAGVAAAFRF
jgi:hypothetical protein